MEAIRVGLPLVPGVLGYEEGVHYNYTFCGHTLRMAMAEPKRAEIQAVQRGQAVFALARREDAIFILSRFGDLPWKAAHYNWWINPPVLRPDAWIDMERLKGGLTVGVCLVNASDGIVAALRAVRLSQELSSMFIEMVQIQMRPPFDPWRYLEVVEQTFQPDADPRSLLKDALCMCVADLQGWEPFCPAPNATLH